MENLQKRVDLVSQYEWELVPTPSINTSVLYKYRFWEDENFSQESLIEAIHNSSLGIVQADAILNLNSNHPNDWIPYWENYQNSLTEPVKKVNPVLMGVDGPIIDLPWSQEFMKMNGLRSHYLEVVAANLDATHWQDLNKYRPESQGVDTLPFSHTPNDLKAHFMVQAALGGYVKESPENIIIMNLPTNIFSKQVRASDFSSLFGKKTSSISAFEFMFLSSRVLEQHHLQSNERLPVVFSVGMYDLSIRLRMLKQTILGVFTHTE